MWSEHLALGGLVWSEHLALSLGAAVAKGEGVRREMGRCGGKDLGL